MYDISQPDPLVRWLAITSVGLIVLVGALCLLDMDSFRYILSEAGPIEVLTAFTFLGTFVYAVWRGRGEFLRHNGYLAVIPLAFGLRELDIVGMLYGWGLVATPPGPAHVTLVERLAVVALVVFIIVCLVRNHARRFLFRFRERLGLHLGMVLLVILGGLSYMTDGQPGKIARLLGSEVGDAIRQLPGIERLAALEEVSELGIAVVMALMFVAWFRQAARVEGAAQPV